GIDYADVVLLGWHNRFPTKKIIAESLKLKESGLIRFIGMSGHNRRLFGKMADEGDSPIDIFMLRYNAAHKNAEQEIFPFLKNDRKPGITAYTATSWGKLLNPKKMPPGEKPLSAADCYRFVLSNSNVDLCMTGPRNEREMLEGFKALELGPLSNNELERIRKIGDFVHG
ncbi:MAG: aldo/keto reductase, partial [Candidatus Zixiibacteriota bacterium]